MEMNRVRLKRLLNQVQIADLSLLATMGQVSNDGLIEDSALYLLDNPDFRIEIIVTEEMPTLAYEQDEELADDDLIIDLPESWDDLEVPAEESVCNGCDICTIEDDDLDEDLDLFFNVDDLE
jgi:hypothetical protein